MAINKKLFGILIGLSIILTPMFVVNASLVPDCGTLTTVTSTDPVTKQPVTTKVMNNPCNFDYLMKLINSVINFLLFIIAAPLVALILIIAGIRLLTSGGSPEAITKAKKMILNAIFGYLIALVAWIVIYAILKTLGYNGPMFLVFK